MILLQARDRMFSAQIWTPACLIRWYFSTDTVMKHETAKWKMKKRAPKNNRKLNYQTCHLTCDSVIKCTNFSGHQSIIKMTCGICCLDDVSQWVSSSKRTAHPLNGEYHNFAFYVCMLLRELKPTTIRSLVMDYNKHPSNDWDKELEGKFHSERPIQRDAKWKVVTILQS